SGLTESCVGPRSRRSARALGSDGRACSRSQAFASLCPSLFRGRSLRCHQGSSQRATTTWCDLANAYGGRLAFGSALRRTNLGQPQLEKRVGVLYLVRTSDLRLVFGTARMTSCYGRILAFRLPGVLTQ